MPKVGETRRQDRLTAKHRDELRASGLSDETIDAAGLRSESDRAELERILGWYPPGAAGSALVYEFYGLDGRDGYARLKFDTPRSDKPGKVVKYESPVGKPNEVYFPPDSKAAVADPRCTLFLTEGEKKSLKATQEGFPCIGLVGVYGWKVGGEERLLPELETISWPGRRVFIVFDSDIATNADVANAAERLAKLLASRGADVRTVILPPGIADGNPVKVGLDDYLLAYGADALRRLLDSATENPLPAAGGAGSQGSDDRDVRFLLDLAEETELWLSTTDVTCATLTNGGHREHWPIKSTALRHWLARCLYERTKRVVRSSTMGDVLNTLGGLARFKGKVYPFPIRVASHDDRIYLDLADENWRAVEIDSDGWRIVADPPARFRRKKGLLALPEPEPGGSVDDLRQFVNVSDNDWPLLVAWLVAAFRPTNSYPILKLLAEQGAGKTTTARVLRALIDPNTAPARSPPREERDLVISANNGWVINFDNLSYVSNDLSDALCRLATGVGFSVREHYENDEEMIFAGARPIIVNGIEDIGTRSDFLDRALIVELPRIEPENRRPEKLFWKEFEKARPRILGALLDAVVAALRNLPAVEKLKVSWPRMADFAMWAMAAEPALGLAPGSFLSAYASNRETANQTALESSPVVVALTNYLIKSRAGFLGTATELLEKISFGQDIRAKAWPKNARALSGMLKRLAPNLRGAGIAVEEISMGHGNNKRKGWDISGALGVTATSPPPAPVAKPVEGPKPDTPFVCRMKAGLAQSGGI